MGEEAESLTPFPFWVPVDGVTMADVSASDFAVVVYREDDVWEAEVLPTALTENLDGLIHALRQQPGIGGAIGLAAVGDDFFVALRVLGSHVSVFLSDVTASVDWTLAKQVLDYLDIPVPEDEDLDQVLPVGDMSIFADLGIDEMELGALSGDLDLFPDEVLAPAARRIGFGQSWSERWTRPSARSRSRQTMTGYLASFEPAMQEAIAEARASAAATVPDVPVGAVVLDPAGVVIGRGRNLRDVSADPHCARGSDGPARRRSRRRAARRLDDCTLVVTLEPCTMCAGAVLAGRLARLVYGALDPRAGAAGSVWDVLHDPRLGQPVEVLSGVLAEECAALLREFFDERR